MSDWSWWQWVLVVCGVVYIICKGIIVAHAIRELWRSK